MTRHLTLVHSSETVEEPSISEQLTRALLIDPPGLTELQRRKRERRINGLLTTVMASADAEVETPLERSLREV